MIRQLRLLGGFVLIICGLLGLILPIIPGIPLLIAGAALLGANHPLVRPFARRFEQWRNRHHRSPSTGETTGRTSQDQGDNRPIRSGSNDGAQHECNIEQEDKLMENHQRKLAKVKLYSVLASLALTVLLIVGLALYLPRGGSQTQVVADKADKTDKADKGGKKHKGKPKKGDISDGQAITGGTYEASAVVHVRGADGVLFVDDNSTDEIYWMQVNQSGEQVGAVETIKLGASVIDPEGMTYDGTNYYIVGSQSRAKGGAQNALVRFGFDAASRRVTKAETISDLRGFLLANVPELQAKKGEGGGLNIEGIAWDPMRKRMLLGLRSPLENGQALVIALTLRDQQGAFSIDNLVLANPHVARLPLNGLGIRSIEYDERLKAFSIIAGAPEQQERTEFRVWEWNGDDKNPLMTQRAMLHRDLKPEGLGRVSTGGTDFMFVVCDTSRYLTLDETGTQ